MPWSDLSEVTAALTRLIERNIDFVLSPGLNVNVVATPPDQLGTTVLNTISLYLYHVRETAEAQNRPGPGLAQRRHSTNGTRPLLCPHGASSHQRHLRREVEQR